MADISIINDDVLYIYNLRSVPNLAVIRAEYNSILFCRGGRIQLEVGGNNQLKVLPGQLLLIPTGKLVQPLLVSTDIDASALLISDKLLKSILGNQINIWNKAMYMKEIYIVQQASWLEGINSYSRSIFGEIPNDMEGLDRPLYHEIATSFLRTLLLLICGELIKHREMQIVEDVSTTHEKQIFNQFLQLLSRQEHKHQRVSFYAEKMNITAKYLSLVIKRVSGKSPMRWITESVMEDCYTMLSGTDLSVKEIAYRLGFPNASFFGQYFREQAGMTPMEYRVKY